VEIDADPVHVFVQPDEQLSAARRQEDAWPDEWPEGGLDLTGVEIRNPGEDVAGARGPRELIISALRKLPDLEQDRIGLTALLAKAEASGEPVDLAALRGIWESRQAELREAIEVMSESAEVMAELIEGLKGSHTARADKKAGIKKAGGSEEVEAEEKQLEATEKVVTERRVAALESLEEYLADLDNARDFHDALGGWPHLTRLIAPRPRWRLVLPPSFSPSSSSAAKSAAAAEAAEAAGANPETPDEVRGLAALVVGTAIKNTEKYQLWVLEAAVQDWGHADATEEAPDSQAGRVEAAEAGGGEAGGASKARSRLKKWAPPKVPPPRWPASLPANETVLSSLVELLRSTPPASKGGAGFPGGGAQEEGVVSPKGAASLVSRRRALYALGSALRNNPLVQACFLELGGVAALADAVGPPGAPPGGGGGGGLARTRGGEWNLRAKGVALALDLLAELDHLALEQNEHNEQKKAQNASQLSSEAAALALKRRAVLEALGAQFRSLEWRRLVALCLEDGSGAPVKAHADALRAVARQWQPTGGGVQEKAEYFACGENSSADLQALAAATVRPQVARLRRRYGACAKTLVEEAPGATRGGGQAEECPELPGLDPEYAAELAGIAQAALEAIDLCAAPISRQG